MRKFFAILTRKIPKIANEQELDYRKVDYENIEEILAIPIANGMCQYKDIYELSLYDFFIMNEILAIKSENEPRAYKAMERASKAK